MSYVIETSSDFDREAKKLKKRYKSFVGDLNSFVDDISKNPLQGVELSPGIRKIRMAITSKGGGKSGGARVITANAIVAEQQGRIAFLYIYDKADASNIKLNVIKKIAHEMGY